MRAVRPVRPVGGRRALVAAVSVVALVALSAGAGAAVPALLDRREDGPIGVGRLGAGPVQLIDCRGRPIEEVSVRAAAANPVIWRAVRRPDAPGAAAVTLLADPGPGYRSAPERAFAPGRLYEVVSAASVDGPYWTSVRFVPARIGPDQVVLPGGRRVAIADWRRAQACRSGVG